MNKQNPSKHDIQIYIYIQNNISTATQLRKSVIFQILELLQRSNVETVEALLEGEHPDLQERLQRIGKYGLLV